LSGSSEESGARDRNWKLLRSHGGAAWLVFAALAGLFAGTTLLSAYYHAELRRRADDYFRKGVELERDGRVPQAVEEYRSALASTPRDDRYQLALAGALAGLGRHNEAAAYLSEIIEDEPNNAVANRMLGRIAVRQGRIADATTDYHRAIYGLWPDEPRKNRIDARFELIGVLTRAGEKQQSFAELLQLAADTPGDAAVKNRVGALLLDLGHPSNARDIYQEVLALEQKDAQATAGLAEAEFALRNYQAAEAEFRRAIRLEPQNARARERLEESERILAADPMLAGLSAAERYARSRELVRAILDSLDRCSPAGPSAAPGPAADARQFLRRARPRRGSDITSDALSLAATLWKARVAACGPAPAGQEWLSLVMRELER
jgi:tetratricopeptide (TPR) repeat protein